MPLNPAMYVDCPERHAKIPCALEAAAAHLEDYQDPNGFSPTAPPPPLPPPPNIDPALLHQGGLWLSSPQGSSPQLSSPYTNALPYSLPSAPFTFSVSPLPASQFSSQPPAPTPGSRPLSSKPQPYTSKSAKPPCSRNCGRVAGSTKCSRILCNQCCERLGGCTYSEHRKKATTTALNGNPAALARPPAVVPASGPSASQLPQDVILQDDPAPKLHRKPMDRKWEELYKAGVDKQRQLHQQQDEKQVQARRAEHQVRICYYSMPDQEPRLICEQELPHFPQFNPSLLPRLLQKLKLDAEDEVYMYDYDLMMWAREDLNTTTTVKSGQTLIYRHLNVAAEECPRLQEMLNLQAPGKSTSKRKADLQPARRVTQQPRTDNLPPRSSPLMPSTTPPSSRTPSQDIVKLLTDPLADADSDADNDNVIDLTIDHQPWPAGIYVRDIARAFGRINTKSGAGDVKKRFESEYPGTSYIKQTYYRQMQFWKDSTQAERDSAPLVPRNAEGLWTRWRTSLSGYSRFHAKIKKEKR
ncbi:hypothetical protein C8F01DRAFT_1248314 [Mycena amicta]|nr:hypothetical protein C8F01DRAFT_1248314 [Mycena amicta]